MDTLLTVVLDLLDVLFGGMLVELAQYLLAVFALPALFLALAAIGAWALLG